MKKIKKILESFPLYKSLEINIEESGPLEICGETYNSYCRCTKSVQTFELELLPKLLRDKLGSQPAIGGNRFLQRDLKDDNNKLFGVYHYIGLCKHCKINEQHFLINVYSDSVDEDSLVYDDEISDKKVEVVKIRKIGQFPAFSIEPNSEIALFLGKQDLVFYKRALMNLSSNYGIGAFAYFRRIIENQIKNICKELISIDNSGKASEIYIKFKENHRMSDLIEQISPFMPTELKALGDNPLKLIYNQLSGGIHVLSDEDCYEKAISVDLVLQFIITTLNKEKNKQKFVIEAINKLKQ